MKIGELASQAGLNASAIRYYEKTGLLSPPHRVGGQWRYAADALNRVLLIRFASEMGFSLPEIKIFLTGMRDGSPLGPRWKKLAQAKIQDVVKNMQRERPEIAPRTPAALPLRLPEHLRPTINAKPPPAIPAPHVDPAQPPSPVRLVRRQHLRHPRRHLHHRRNALGNSRAPGTI